MSGIVLDFVETNSIHLKRSLEKSYQNIFSVSELLLQLLYTVVLSLHLVL